LADLAKKNCRPPDSSNGIMVIAGDDGAIASSPLIPGKTSKNVTITVGSNRFVVEGDGFFQSNRPLLERFGTWAGEFLQGDRCVDLYGGSGFFSVLLAHRFKSGLLVESVGGQAAAARENFRRNGIAHFDAHEGLAEDLVVLVKKESIDCLIVDPPRTGLSDKVRAAIAVTKPRTILYVSCNPSTQARDAGFLITKAGFVIERTALFDLYPNTHHIESIMLLRRS
jgi:tRNA/tmRNA/rRNA uracil-C5-methylase (TrmA/RlmC/RlmD family)